MIQNKEQDSCLFKSFLELKTVVSMETYRLSPWNDIWATLTGRSYVWLYCYWKGNIPWNPQQGWEAYAEDIHPFCAICSKRLYRTRELESWVPNLTRPKDRAMQDGAEAIKMIRGCPVKSNTCYRQYKSNKGLMCLEREYYKKGKAVNRCAENLRKDASTTECSIKSEQVNQVRSLALAEWLKVHVLYLQAALV